MTIEEAKHKLDYMKKAYQKLIDEKVDSGKLVCDGVSGEWKAETPLDEAYKSMIDALEMAIKALEQQYCGDCISREETLKALMDEWTEFDSELMDYLIEKVKKLPSVTPQQKVGYISIDDVMAVFDDFMRGDVDENNTETFLEMLKDKAEGSDKE